MTAASTAVGHLACMEKTVARLTAQLEELSLCHCVWDDRGERVGRVHRASEFCRLICRRTGPGERAMREVAQRAVAGKSPVHSGSPLGCCILGVPLRHRRRVAGAVVACFPPREMIEEETLARLCDRMHLDREVMTALGQAACHRRADEAEGTLDFLVRMLRAEHELQVAREELATLSINLASTYEELSLVYRISGSMRVTQQGRDFIQDVCDELLEVMDLEMAAAVVRAHGPDNPEDIIVLSGEPVLDAAQVQRLVTDRVLPQLGRGEQVVLDNRFDEPKLSLWGRKIRRILAAPLLIEDEVIGTVIGLNKIATDFDSVDLKLINSISNQVGVFLANNRLYADLRDLLMGVLHALTASIDAKDPYTCGHSERVALVSRRLAEAMGFTPEKVQQIYLSGLMHDVGKIGVPESTLRKEGRLTDEEYEGMKRHPSLGGKILGGIRQMEQMLPGILSHHERPDGRGYPKGLRGAEVSIEARIVGLADAFDAMTSDRTYRKALPLEVVVGEILEHAGQQFDPQLVDILLSMDLEALLAEIRRDDREHLTATRPQDGEE